MTDNSSLLVETIECDGAAACDAQEHVHGCFSDFGNCDEPSEHLCRCERPCVGPGIYPSCLDCGGRIGG